MNTRQSTEYSCGASALQAVLSYWGVDLEERELMKRLRTTPETGTYPEDIVRVAREMGFRAEVRDSLTIEDIQRFTKKGHPVIVLGQAWRSREESDKALADDWEDGHYAVILEVDNSYVYFEDPYLRLGKGFIPRHAFEEGWHNISGASEDSSKQAHLGIFIQGERPAGPKSLKEIDASKLDFDKIAPLQIMVVRFEGDILPYDILQETRPIFETGLIKPAAYIFLRKDPEGSLTAIEGGNLQEEEEAIEVDALLAAIAGFSRGGRTAAEARALKAAKAASEGDFGLPAKDILQIGSRLPENSSAMILLFEHIWAKRFNDIISSYGGVIAIQEIIGRDTLSRLGQILSEDHRM